MSTRFNNHILFCCWFLCFYHRCSKQLTVSPSSKRRYKKVLNCASPYLTQSGKASQNFSVNLTSLRQHIRKALLVLMPFLPCKKHCLLVFVTEASLSCVSMTLRRLSIQLHLLLHLSSGECARRWSYNGLQHREARLIRKFQCKMVIIARSLDHIITPCARSVHKG